jgi:hypothetical protein
MFSTNSHCCRLQHEANMMILILENVVTDRVRKGSIKVEVFQLWQTMFGGLRLFLDTMPVNGEHTAKHGYHHDVATGESAVVLHDLVSSVNIAYRPELVHVGL